MKHSFAIWRRALRFYIHTGMTLGQRTEEQTDVTLTAKRCKNCGRMITSPFCPQCGQGRDGGRISRSSMYKNLFLGFSSVNGGLARTAWHCLIRPGYLIRDFLSGRRIRYTEPFTTLFVITAFLILVAYLVNPDSFRSEADYSDVAKNIRELRTDALRDDERCSLDRASMALDSARVYNFKAEYPEKDSLDFAKAREEMEEYSWIEDGIGDGYFGTMSKALWRNFSDDDSVWSTIMVFLLLGLVSRKRFRKSSFVKHTNAAEIFVGHMFLAVGIVILSFPGMVFRGTSAENGVTNVMFVLEFAYLVYAYRQLFGLRLFPTVWRTILSILYALTLAVLVIIVIAVALYLFFGIRKGSIG